jgi:hypothetical protein
MKLLSVNRGIHFSVVFVIIFSVMLSACSSNATATAVDTGTRAARRETFAAAAVETQTTVKPTSTTAGQETATPASTEVTTSYTPTSTATTAPIMDATATNLAITQTATQPSLLSNIAADIQNNVNGVMQVLSVTSNNGQVNILLRTTYVDKRYQYGPAYNTIKYLSTYFGGLSNAEIARLFGGKEFSIFLKTFSAKDEYFVESTTSYALLTQVATGEVDQPGWSSESHAYMTMQYNVTALCDVTPDTVQPDTNTPLTIDAWLLLNGKEPLKMKYVTAAWKDSTGHQYYCAGDKFDSSCKGPSGLVTDHDTIMVTVGIESVDGMKFTCQTTYTTP